MNITAADLKHTQYIWTSPLQLFPKAIDNSDFDREQGNSVIDFINLFIAAYVPGASRAAVLQVEGMITSIPENLFTFSESMYWLAKNYINLVRRIRYGLLPTII